MLRAARERVSIWRFIPWFVTFLAAFLFPAFAHGDDDPSPPAPAPVAAPAPAPAAGPAPAPAPAPAPVAAPAPAQPVAADSCLQFAGHPGMAGDAVRALQFAVGDSTQPLADVRVVGLATLSLDEIWRLVDYRPGGPIAVEQAAALIARLAQTGLFARVTPTVRLSPDGATGAVLELALIENPTVRAIDIRGLAEITREEVLDALLHVPERTGDDGDDDDEVTIDIPHGHKIHIDVDHRRRGELIALRCAPPVPPRTWVARHAHDVVEPGIVWRGLAPGLERVQRYLHHEGYLLAQVTATLTPSGALVIAIDEGRLDGVTVDGIHPAIAYDVQRLLGVAPGAILNLTDVRQGIDRVKARFPFVSTTERRHRAAPSLAIVEQAGPEGSATYVFLPGPPTCEGDADDRWFTWVDKDKDSDAERAQREDCAYESSWFELEGRHLIIHLASDRADADASGIELLRHTPVTGWAPGLLLTTRAWDPADRVHFRFDTLFNINTSRSNVAARGSGTLGELAAAQRIDFLVSPSIAVPRLSIAELGGALYTLTDTDDAWRVTRLDSYLNSGLWGRPERDYFRRTGATAFATLHLLDTLTLGGEYRYDRYDSLTTASDPDTIFGDHIPVNPPITEGIIGSMLVRVEWATEKASLYKVNAMADRRPAQGSIVDRPSPHRISNGLRSVATLEIANQSLGGDLKFWRATSDSILSLTTGHDSGVSVRFRIAGGRDLPLQRQEALGGWGSLRGYDFKELGGGDLSTLLSLEYRFDPVSAFVDAGSLRSPTSDGKEVHLGLGAALDLGDSGQLAFAWRTDERATATPEIRLLFGRPW